MAIQIDLTTEQLKRAEQEALRRQSVNEARGLRGRNRAAATGPKALELHRLGCTGEIAVAAYLGLGEQVFTESEAVRGSRDLPGGIEVKTRPKHGYDLLVQLDDDPSKLFVLVTHESGGTTRLVGSAMLRGPPEGTATYRDASGSGLGQWRRQRSHPGQPPGLDDRMRKW